jgi:hypothetical protein
VSEMLNQVDVFRELREACRAAGGQKAWAERHGVSQTFLSDVLNAKCGPGTSILRPLGLVQVTVYRRLQSGNRRIPAPAVARATP